LKGSLIVIEGTDGVGRSTQVEQLKPWLEVEGHAVVSTGWTRSPLLSETINEAKAGHELNVTTFSLLYAADFADRLENEIIPALQAGFVVLADRYMYTAFARNTVMGADPAWSRSLFGLALVPDLVLYLRVDAKAWTTGSPECTLRSAATCSIRFATIRRTSSGNTTRSRANSASRPSTRANRSQTSSASYEATSAASWMPARAARGRSPPRPRQRMKSYRRRRNRGTGMPAH
jgi:hypothetical protein